MRVISFIVACGLAISSGPILGQGLAAAEDPLKCPAGMSRSHPNQGVSIRGGVSGQLYLCNGVPGAEGGSTKWVAAFLVEHGGVSAVTLGVSGAKTRNKWDQDVPNAFPHNSAGSILYSPPKTVPSGRQVQAVLHVGPNEDNRQHGANFDS